MIDNFKVVVALPADIAAMIFEKIYVEILHEIIDQVVLVDNGSDDNAVDIGRRIGITHIIPH